jgi:nicotinate phosphoribosyltransferase
MNPAPNAKPAIDWRLFPCFGKGLLDNDTYNLLMMQFVFFYYRDTKGRYKLTDRGKTPMPPEFELAYRKQIRMYSEYIFEPDEIKWLRTLGLFKEEFLEFLKTFRIPTSGITLQTNEAGTGVDVWYEGYWMDYILWEVPLLYMRSELKYEMLGEEGNDEIFWEHLKRKVQDMNEAGCHVIDMSPRRRRSFEYELKMVKYYHLHAPETFLGTSNMHIAYILGIQPKGTFAHQLPMALQAIHGTGKAYEVLLEKWKELYGDKLRVALTDTFTTEFFLKMLKPKMRDHYIIFRQDSGDPREVAWQYINYWREHGIDPKTRWIIFSDSLDDKKAIALQKEFGPITNVLFGIGTFLGNDCGLTPLNIVIKLTHILVNGVWVEVVKESDSAGKHHGSAEALERTRIEKEEALALLAT